MLNAIRRFKTLVSHGINGFNEENSDQPIVLCKMSKFGSDHKIQIGISKRSITEEKNVVKPEIWNVEVEDVDGEDAQTKALRLFRFKILYMACSLDPTPESLLDRTDIRYKPSPDYDTVRACRLVCKDWYDEISAIFLATDRPLLTVNPATHLQKRRRQGTTQDPASILETLSCPLVRPSFLQYPHSDLSFPPFKLQLPSSFFYKEIENEFIHGVLPQFERYVFELQCYLPADSTMRFYWPTLNLESLRAIKFKCTNDTQAKVGGLSALHPNPFQHGNYMYFIQQVLNGAVNAELLTLQSYAPHFAPGLFKLILPRRLAFLDVPLVRMTEDDYDDCLEYDAKCCNNLKCDGIRCPYNMHMKHLIIRSPLRNFRREEVVNPTHAAFLIEKYRKSLETLELDISGQEMDHIIWTMRRDYVYEPLALDISRPMPNLQTFSIHAGNWEICGMNSYQRILPSLKTLRLTLINRETQIKNLYKYKSETVERLKLSFMNEMPYEVMRGFADHLPNLKELEVVVREKYPGLYLVFQGFLKLKKLHIIYANCNSEEGRELLNWAVTGIPVETLRAINNGDVTMSEVIESTEDNPSLRSLFDLEELKLYVKSNYTLDASIMLRTTFLRMPKLKRLILSERTVIIEDDQKDFIRKENQHGLSLEWI